MEFGLLLKIQCCWLGGIFGKESEEIREELCLMYREREREAEAESNKEKKNPRLPEIVFYVTWLAADVITSD